MSYFNNVLLVDDDASSNFLHTLIIRDCGFSKTVNTCSNGREALDFLKKHWPQTDLIFLDLNMPVMNGFEFLDQLPHDINVVVLTASQDPEDLKRIESYPVLACMPKPVTAEMLRDLYASRYCA